MYGTGTSNGKSTSLTLLTVYYAGYRDRRKSILEITGRRGYQEMEGVSISFQIWNEDR